MIFVKMLSDTLAMTRASMMIADEPVASCIIQFRRGLKFDELKWRTIHGRQTRQAMVEFSNGYECSIVCGPYSYGGYDGLYELAVKDAAHHIVYDTPITNDVLGNLSEAKVMQTIRKIAKLPQRVQS